MAERTGAAGERFLACSAVGGFGAGSGWVDAGAGAGPASGAGAEAGAGPASGTGVCGGLVAGVRIAAL